MKCHSKERDKQTKDFCERQAVKECRHRFATCNKHFHGCKNEELKRYTLSEQK